MFIKILQFNTMMRFNRGFGVINRYFGSTHSDPSIPKVKDLTQNKQLRDKLHLPFLQEADKQFLYEQSRIRKTTSLYNIMAHLPNGVTRFFTKFVSDPKVVLTTDNLYLPRLSKNGVPIYDSLRASKFVVLLRNFEGVVPFLLLLNLHYPGPMLFSLFVTYFGLYRPIYQKFTDSFVIKMELVPETEQIIIQKAGPFGFMKTFRIKTDDLQIQDRSVLNIGLYRTTRSFVDKNLIFKVKSTGQLLFFDPDGIWYEEGINHELLI